MFAYEPPSGYRDERDAVELPWERWQQEASARGGDIVSLFVEDSETEGDGRPDDRG